MSTKSILHQAKLNEWAIRLADQKSSGLSVAAWCEQNNLSQYKFFYWKRLLKDEAITQMLPEIVPLALPTTIPNGSDPLPVKSNTTCATSASCASFQSSTCARVFINGITIELDSSASEVFIKNLIKAVRYV